MTIVFIGLMLSLLYIVALLILTIRINVPVIVTVVLRVLLCFCHACPGAARHFKLISTTGDSDRQSSDPDSRGPTGHISMRTILEFTAFRGHRGRRCMPRCLLLIELPSKTP